MNPAPAAQLRALLDAPGLQVMPCCFDALSARLIEQAGFELTFMGGFAVSASRLGMPDTGLISFGEMLDQGRNICSRRCRGCMPRSTHGTRAPTFWSWRAPMPAPPKDSTKQWPAARPSRKSARTSLFLEAPQSESEMIALCQAIPGPKMANLVEGGETPLLPPKRLQEIGYKIAAYPLTLLSAATAAMLEALHALKNGDRPTRLVDFDRLRDIVGFKDYDAEAERYRVGD